MPSHRAATPRSSSVANQRPFGAKATSKPERPDPCLVSCSAILSPLGTCHRRTTAPVEAPTRRLPSGLNASCRLDGKPDPSVLAFHDATWFHALVSQSVTTWPPAASRRPSRLKATELPLVSRNVW